MSDVEKTEDLSKAKATVELFYGNEDDGEVKGQFKNDGMYDIDVAIMLTKIAHNVYENIGLKFSYVVLDEESNVVASTNSFTGDNNE